MCAAGIGGCVARVLWISDAGSHTGLGRVTHEIAGGLVRMGHDISVLGLNYLGDYSPETVGLKIYRANSKSHDDTFGTRRVAELVDLVDPDVIVIAHDPQAVWQYIFQNPWDPEQSLLTRPLLAYVPVDGYDYAPELTELLPRAANIVAMSKHGATTFRPSAMVYHGVDTDTFHPLEDKRACREALDMDPDKFLVLRVDTNSGRKDYAATIKAVAPLLEKHRDMALHLHASGDPRMPGVNIPVMVSRYDFAPDQLSMSDLPVSTTGWPDERMRLLYNAADVFVSTSRGEGFGLTIAEALACGVPVIAQNVAAIPEVVGPGGILIEPQRRLTVPAGQDLWLADIDAFTEALETLYADPALRAELGMAGRKHVTESFRWDTAVDRFNDFIETAASRWRSSQEAKTDGPG
jgi:glycosyltransferase involved in cell wall biosynthesis